MYIRRRLWPANVTNGTAGNWLLHDVPEFEFLFQGQWNSVPNTCLIIPNKIYQISLCCQVSIDWQRHIQALFLNNWCPLWMETSGFDENFLFQSYLFVSPREKMRRHQEDCENSPQPSHFPFRPPAAFQMIKKPSPNPWYTPKRKFSPYQKEASSWYLVTGTNFIKMILEEPRVDRVSFRRSKVHVDQLDLNKRNLEIVRWSIRRLLWYLDLMFIADCLQLRSYKLQQKSALVHEVWNRRKAPHWLRNWRATNL